MKTNNQSNGRSLLAVTTIAAFSLNASAETKVTLNDFYRPFALTEITPKNMQQWPYYRYTSMNWDDYGLFGTATIMAAATVNLGELTTEDVILECIIGTGNEPDTEHEAFHEREHVKLKPKGKDSHGHALFGIDLTPPLAGLQFYKLRLYPSHPLLSHRFETGRIIWL